MERMKNKCIWEGPRMEVKARYYEKFMKARKENEKTEHQKNITDKKMNGSESKSEKEIESVVENGNKTERKEDSERDDENESKEVRERGSKNEREEWE